MTKLIIRIHNSETNEIIDREMTADELAEYEAGQKLQADKLVAAEQASADKAELLQRLGITADEVKLLLS